MNKAKVKREKKANIYRYKGLINRGINLEWCSKRV